MTLKVIVNDIDVTEEIRARFFREAQACARLNHPNIVTVYDMGEEEGHSTSSWNSWRAANCAS